MERNEALKHMASELLFYVEQLRDLAIAKAPLADRESMVMNISVRLRTFTKYREDEV